MKKRIDYIDGLKGLSALLVAMSHFMLLGDGVGFVGFSTNYTKEEAIAQILNNPLSAFITNNCVGLYIFLVLIAVFPVISFRRKGSNPEVMGRYACKRYFQLWPLCFITSIAMVLIYKGGFLHFDDLSVLVNHPWPASTNPDHSNLLLAIKVMLFDAWFINTREVGSLWCLHIIFKGSIVTYAVYALFGNSKWKYLPILSLFILSLVNVNYLMFAFGAILGEILAENQIKPLSIYASIALIVVSIFIIKIPNNLYPIEVNAAVNGSIGSFLIILSIIKCEKLQAFFRDKRLLLLGKLSFEIVISHMFILGTLTYPIAKWLLTLMDLGFGFGLVIGVIGILLSLPLAYLLNKFVSPLGSKLAKKVEGFCFKD